MGEEAEKEATTTPPAAVEPEKKDVQPPSAAAGPAAVRTPTAKKEGEEEAPMKPLEEADLHGYEYEVAKWIAHSHLKYQKKLIKGELERNAKIKSLNGFSATNMVTNIVTFGEGARENSRLQVDEYWSEHPSDIKYQGLTDRQIESLLYLQAAFRAMLILKRLREQNSRSKKAGLESFGTDKVLANTLMIQCSIRRLLAMKQVEAKIAENLNRDETFAQFCLRMKKGVKVVMYSRKYKTAPSRIIQFSEDLNDMEFTASFGSKGKVELKKIFKVNSGLSGTKYGDTKMAPASKTFCLECLGNRVVDIATDSAREARELIQGFSRMVELLAGKQSPFFIDDLGIPKRAGPSILDNAIKQAECEGDHSRKPYKSKADEMRFWSAVRFLQDEYNTWQDAKDKERRQWMFEREEEERAQAKAREITAKTKSGQHSEHVTKMVRFEDPETGVWRIEAATGKDEEEEEEEENGQEAALPIAPLGPDVEEEGGGRIKMRRKKEPPPSFLGRMFAKKPPTPPAAGGKGRKNEEKDGGDGEGNEGKDGPPRVRKSEKPLYEFTLSEPVEAGATSLPLDRPPGCEKGMRVLMNKGTPLEECRVIEAFGSIILDKPLQFTHPIGTNIGIFAATKETGSKSGSVSGGSDSGRGDRETKESSGAKGAGGGEKKKGFFGALFGKKKAEDEGGGDYVTRSGSFDRQAGGKGGGKDERPEEERSERWTGERGGPPQPQPPLPGSLTLPILSGMGRREQSRLEAEAQGLDDESVRSFVTNQSQLESVLETDWDEASTLGIVSVRANTDDRDSTVWSEVAPSDAPSVIPSNASAASTFPGIPGRPVDELSTVWSEAGPSDKDGIDFSGGRDGGKNTGNVVLTSDPPEAVGLDDAWSQGSWSFDDPKSRFNKYDDEGLSEQASQTSSEGWEAGNTSVKSDQWSEVVSESAAAAAALRKKKQQSFWSRILCMAPQYADGDSDEDYYVQPGGQGRAGAKANRAVNFAATEKGKSGSNKAGGGGGGGGGGKVLNTIEEVEEEFDREELEEEEEGEEGEEEEDDEYEEDDEEYDDEEDEEDVGSEDAVTRAEELAELSD